MTLANGAIRRDLMVSGAKRRFSLAWVALTDAQLATVRTQYALAVAGDVTFVGPDGASCNVNAGSSPAINAEAYRTAGGLRWRASVELWEV